MHFHSCKGCGRLVDSCLLFDMAGGYCPTCHGITTPFREQIKALEAKLQTRTKQVEMADSEALRRIGWLERQLDALRKEADSDVEEICSLRQRNIVLYEVVENLIKLVKE